MKFKTKFTNKDTEDYRKWVSFYPKRYKGVGFNLTYDNNGYFDPRPQIHTNITTLVSLVLPFISLWLLPLTVFLWFYSWGSLYIRLPFDTGRGNTAESKTYGLTFYHPDSGFPNEFWVRGYRIYYFPWAYRFYKREVLHKSGWRKEKAGDDFWDKEKWKNEIVLETFPYKYTLNSGEIQERIATVYQEKRYWRRWFNLQIMCRHYIEIEFDSEVGEKCGSRKGGVVGCSYIVKKGETAEQCLRRMEKERKFK
jgi:hypothetical protein